MRVTFWGVRGSYPVASPNTLVYGGHTSCVQLEVPGVEAPFVLDAGTGIRNLGMRLLEQKFGKGEGTLRLFLSHLHWDHIQGLPFFGPAHVGGNRISVYGRGRDGAPLLDAVLGITRREFFPVGMESFPATLEFTELSPGVGVMVDGVKVLPLALNHPFGSLGYRFEYGGKVVCYITDTSPFDTIRYPEKFVLGPPKSLSEDDRVVLWDADPEALVRDLFAMAAIHIIGTRDEIPQVFSLRSCGGPGAQSARWGSRLQPTTSGCAG